MANPRAVGRPTKLTPELQDEICKLLRAGNYGEVAAEYVGINKGTYYEWKQRGHDDKAAGKSSIYAEFADAVKKAESHAEARAVTLIQQAMPKNWTAAMTYLERKFPDRWGRRDRTEISGPAGGPIQVQPVLASQLSVETLEAVVRELEAPKDEETGE